MSVARNWQLARLVPGKTPVLELQICRSDEIYICYKSKVIVTLEKLISGSPPVEKNTLRNARGIALMMLSWMMMDLD